MVVIPAQAEILMQPAIPTKALRLPVELAMTILRNVIKPPMYLKILTSINDRFKKSAVIPAQAGILMQPATPTKALRLPVERAMTILHCH